MTRGRHWLEQNNHSRDCITVLIFLGKRTVKRWQIGTFGIIPTEILRNEIQYVISESWVPESWFFLSVQSLGITQYLPPLNNFTTQYLLLCFMWQKHFWTNFYIIVMQGDCFSMKFSWLATWLRVPRILSWLTVFSLSNGIILGA